MNKKVELLAPAGNYEAFMGALNAGADAVYLGGEKFGARAYADNFTEEEICRALHTAHFMGRKIYLTVNTLLKENEAAGLYDYLLPFYERGLDGVIVQDLGVLRMIRVWFPKLPLHVSTQMTVTGQGGASILKEQGAVRIVPARELSLAEVCAIKKETGLEVECFIHGAMCYSYSGQCLFSSILGGRSGNRGRCAQPCRLPYQIYAGREQVLGEGYPLSLKDMCTLEYIPQLIEAGIDSFKIEGRMKKPAYAAGVTAVYRKYIDRYYCQGADGYRVEPEDMDRLRGLYIRSEIQTGYYERHNGKEMITLTKPGYIGSDDSVLAQIQAAYLHEPEKMPVRMSVKVVEGEPIRAQMTGVQTKRADASGTSQEELSADIIQAEAIGEVTQTAQKAPLQPEDIRKQMTKTGNSCVKVVDCEIQMAGRGFVPVRALNQLRRDVIEVYEREVIAHNGLCDMRTVKNESVVQTTGEEDIIPGPSLQVKHSADCSFRSDSLDHTVCFAALDKQKNRPIQSTFSLRTSDHRPNQSTPAIPAKECLVTTYEQLKAVHECGCERIFIESDLFLQEYEKILALAKGSRARKDERNTDTCAYYLALPHILRKRDEVFLQRLTQKLAEEGLIAGFLLRNLEGLFYVRNLQRNYAVIPDTGLYCFHKETLKFWKNYGEEYTLPYELNAKEASHLAAAARGFGMRTSLVAYGRIPMMVTANCLRKTAGICPSGAKDGRQIYLKDRYQTTFPVAVNCEHCYNILYNSVPYSLHTSLKEAGRVGADVWRYDFVMESGTECRQILTGEFPFADYTAGHLKRGVE